MIFSRNGSINELERLKEMIIEYFHWKDVPSGWGLGEMKRKSEEALRDYVKKKNTEIKWLK